MDLMTMNDDNQPERMVELYDSLIWTERFNTIGDFQITTGDVDRFMDLLPEGQVVTLRESSVPMIVESHLIERKKNTPTKLTIKGRDFCSICDRRVAVIEEPGMSDWILTMKTPSDVAYLIMSLICEDGLAAVEDIFDPAMVTFPDPADFETSTGPVRSFVIPRGNLLASMLPFLQAEAPLDVSTTPDTPAVVPHGIRAVRPGLSDTDIQIQIYTGTDRRNTVYFDARRDQLDDGSYLFSKVGSATTAVVVGASDLTIIEKDLVVPEGMDRRVILVDASTGGLTETQTLEQAKISLREAHVTAMFDGSLNQDLSPYKYNVDYHLGDIVKLVGDYGLSSSARVTEYIRSEDSTGVKSYPTLVTIDE